MSKEEIKSNLCYYDPENPNNNLEAFDEEDRPQPRKECSCDEARSDLAEEMKFHHRTHAELVQTQCQLQDAIRERDEAREERDKMRNAAVAFREASIND